tara:strand:+ start:207 stop:329 length:123 start_codon:yes stop_codon:yes gene_type:complete
MKPTTAHYAEAEHVLSFPWDYSVTLFALALRFRKQHGTKP